MTLVAIALSFVIPYTCLPFTFILKLDSLKIHEGFWGFGVGVGEYSEKCEVTKA